MTTKKCSQCGEDKSLDSYSKSKVEADGLQRRCKACWKLYRDANKEKAKLYMAEYQRKNADRLREYKRAKYDPVVNSIRCAEWRKNNVEVVKAASKEKYKRNRDAIRAKAAAWASANPERVKERNREYHIRNKERRYDIVRKWKKNNPHKVLALTRGRQVAKIKRTPPWSNKSIVDFFYATRKWISDVTGVMWHVDHVIPLRGRAVSGLHVHNNLQVIPASVNTRKLNKYVVELDTTRR